MLYDVGRVCIKLAGRDAGKYCVVVKQEGSKVLIDGQTRRRMCNVLHLEPTSKHVDIKENADSAAVAVALKSIDIEVEKKGEKRSPGPRPLSKRVAKAAQK